MENCNENVIEWFKGEKRATLTLTQGCHCTRIKKLSEGTSA